MCEAVIAICLIIAGIITGDPMYLVAAGLFDIAGSMTSR